MKNRTEKAKLTNGLKFSNECKIKVNWISHWVLTETLWKGAPQWISETKNRACSKILITFYTLITASNNICSETFFHLYVGVVHVLRIGQERPASAQPHPLGGTHWGITGRHINTNELYRYWNCRYKYCPSCPFYYIVCTIWAMIYL